MSDPKKIEYFLQDLRMHKMGLLSLLVCIILAYVVFSFLSVKTQSVVQNQMGDTTITFSMKVPSNIYKNFVETKEAINDKMECVNRFGMKYCL